MPDPQALITIRVPGSMHDAFDMFTIDDALSDEAPRRDLRAAWNQAEQRKHGKTGTVYVLTLPAELGPHFTNLVDHVRWSEANALEDGEADNPDHSRATVRAARALLVRLAAMGFDPDIVPDAYSGDNTPEQLERDARAAADRARLAAEHAAYGQRLDDTHAQALTNRSTVSALLTTAGMTVADYDTYRSTEPQDRPGLGPAVTVRGSSDGSVSVYPVPGPDARAAELEHLARTNSTAWSTLHTAMTDDADTQSLELLRTASGHLGDAGWTATLLHHPRPRLIARPR